MNLSRKWLNEFVTVTASDKEFAEAMTLSGSKVEVTEDLGAELSNVVVVRSFLWSITLTVTICGSAKLNIGEDEPVQIVTGAWNVHVGDMVPVAKHKSTLPGGVKIEKGKLARRRLQRYALRSSSWVWMSVISPMLPLPQLHCEHYKALILEKPSIPADIKAGDKIFGSVVAAEVLECTAIFLRTFPHLLEFLVTLPPFPTPTA